MNIAICGVGRGDIGRVAILQIYWIDYNPVPTSFNSTLSWLESEPRSVL